MYHDAGFTCRSPSVAHFFCAISKYFSIIVLQLLVIYGEKAHADGFPAEEAGLIGRAIWGQPITSGQAANARARLSAQTMVQTNQAAHNSPFASVASAEEFLPALLANNATPESVPFAERHPGGEIDHTTLHLAECTESSPAVGDDPRLVTDCTTLLKSRDILDPPGNDLNWSVDLVMTDWEGVRITEGKVTRLDLSSKENLSGSVPAELGDLTELTVLNLRDNDLSGPIPAELGNLTKLTTLDLWENNLVGSIPTEIENLTNLNTLDLSHNNLIGSIPTELEKLINLIYLDLSINDLTGSIPPELAKLTNLRILWLGNNPLTGSIPPEFGNLANMEQLSFANSNLTGSVPAELGNLSRMQVLYVSNNALTGSIPIELGNLNTLSSLTLNGNNLTGPIPAELGKATSLERLYLSQNNLTGPIPAELGNLARLKRLRLYGNSLTGCIPKNVNRLGAGMGSEYIPNPQRGGSLPTCEHETCIASTPAVGGDARLVEACTTLFKVKDALDPSGSQLNWSYDRLMTEWSGVEISGSKVVSLNLASSNLSGSIPPELGKLTNLTSLNLRANNLGSLWIKSRHF